jgi:hypothetical protein
MGLFFTKKYFLGRENFLAIKVLDWGWMCVRVGRIPRKIYFFLDRICFRQRGRRIVLEKVMGEKNFSKKLG